MGKDCKMASDIGLQGWKRNISKYYQM